LVEALRGSIEVGTAPEGGALFTVRVPAHAVTLPEPAPEPPPVPLPHTTRPRVLIIDDEAMLARAFHATLERSCDVDVALGGRQALERFLAGERYDFVFCDLMMADIGGAQLYAELKARAPGRERELIFMTGGVYDPAVAAFLASIDNRCVDKPFDIRREIFADAKPWLE
jgi:two-component system NtrC family sensor kinase